jgi:uncharacterized protein YidB (DUF937 family)
MMDLNGLIKMASDPKVRELVMNLVGQFMGKGGGGQQSMNGLISTLEENGMGDQVKSWVGTGDNKPISPDQVEQVIGADKIGQAAQAAGMSPEEAKKDLSQILPALVDQATPQGQASSQMPDIEAMLKQFMGGSK